MPRLPKLYTFAISHFSEKARWALDFCEVPYYEKPLTPFIHVPVIRRIALKTTVPVLELNDRVIQGSTEVMQWAHEQNPEAKLFGGTEREQKKVAELIEAHSRLGFHVMRYGYSDLLKDRETTVVALTWASSPLQTVAVKVAFPLMKTALEKFLKISTESAERSSKAIIDDLDALHKQLGKSGYLVGRKLTAADITIASLIAPLAAPEEHAVYRTLRNKVGDEFSVLRTHPMMDWARQIYAKHRYSDEV